jgi:hypothetical protein
MILHKELYLNFIIERGVGENDRVADSRLSYISYLNSVSKLIGKNIGPDILTTEADISKIKVELDGKRAPSTISNYCSAMRQYIAFVKSEGLA